MLGDVPADPHENVSFSSEIAREVLGKAGESSGLQVDGAKLIRFGQNAIFRLADDPVVVRVGRAPDRMPILRRELCVARWLDSQAVPVAVPYDHVAHPLNVNGYPVSFWHAVDDGLPRPDAADLARLLSKFHRAGASACDLPPLDALAEVGPRLRAAHNIPNEDREFMRRYAEELSARYRGLRFELPPGPLHGDAHTGNLLGRHSAAFLTDFEAAATGPREWDLTPVAVGHLRLGLPRDEYRAFVAAYGFDVIEWDGFDILRGIREIGMITWLMQNVDEGQHVADEFAHRLKSIRDGDDTREWHAF